MTKKNEQKSAHVNMKVTTQARSDAGLPQRGSGDGIYTMLYHLMRRPQRGGSVLAYDPTTQSLRHVVDK